MTLPRRGETPTPAQIGYLAARGIRPCRAYRLWAANRTMEAGENRVIRVNHEATGADGDEAARRHPPDPLVAEG